MSLLDSKSYIELVPVTKKYDDALKSHTQKMLGREEKGKIAGIKKLYRYEQQFRKLGYNQEKAREKALAEIKLDSYTQGKQEITRQQAIKEDNKRGFFNSTFWTTNVFGRAFSVALGNSISKGLSSTIKGVGDNLSKATSLIDRRDYLKNITSTTGKGKNKKIENLQDRLTKHYIETGQEVREAAQSFETLSSIVGNGRGMGLIGRLKNFADPLYSATQVANDFASALKGSQIDLGGSFAKRLGMGQSRKFNALLEQQQVFIQAGIYKDEYDPRLLKEREKLLGGMGNRQGRFQRSNAAKGLSTVKASEQDLAYKGYKGLIDGVQSAIKLPNSTEEWFKQINSKSITAIAGAQSNDPIVQVTAGLNVLTDVVKGISETLKERQNEATRIINNSSALPKSMTKSEGVNRNLGALVDLGIQ